MCFEHGVALTFSRATASFVTAHHHLLFRNAPERLEVMHPTFSAYVVVLFTVVAVATMNQTATVRVYTSTARAALPVNLLFSRLNVVSYKNSRIGCRDGLVLPPRSGICRNVDFRPATVNLAVFAFCGACQCPPSYFVSCPSASRVRRLRIGARWIVRDTPRQFKALAAQGR